MFLSILSKILPKNYVFAFKTRFKQNKRLFRLAHQSSLRTFGVLTQRFGFRVQTVFLVFWRKL